MMVLVFAVFLSVSTTFSYFWGRHVGSRIIQRTFQASSRRHHHAQAQRLKDEEDIASLEIPPGSPAWDPNAANVNLSEYKARRLKAFRKVMRS